MSGPSAFVSARLDEGGLPPRVTGALRAILAMKTGTGSSSEWSGWAAAHGDAVAHLAAIWNYHPDYDPEWVP